MAPKRTGRFSLLLPILVLGGFLYGLYHLLTLRFEGGDVYPAYSSLRADPLGTKALFDGLSNVKGISVERNYGPAEKLAQPAETTLMDLGEDLADVIDFPASEGKDLESKILQGSRVVISLVGENGAEDHVKKDVFAAEPTSTPTSAGPVTFSGGVSVAHTPTPSSTPTSTSTPQRTMGKEWGIGAGHASLPETKKKGFFFEDEKYEPVLVHRAGSFPIPAVLFWHSSIYFKDLDPAWKVLYLRDDHPVAVERRLGKGSLVLLSDSYLLSDEAMLKDLHSDLLVYLIGDNRRVVFDETHLGVYESPNTATLARKYGLQGFALGLLVLALLFIWRYSSSLVPPPEDEAAGAVSGLSGKDYSSGLVNLLKRNVPVRDLLRTCFEEWKKSFAQGRGYLAPKVRAMEKELGGLAQGKEGAHPVEGYLRLRRIFKDRR